MSDLEKLLHELADDAEPAELPLVHVDLFTEQPHIMFMREDVPYCAEHIFGPMEGTLSLYRALDDKRIVGLRIALRDCKTILIDREKP